MRHSLTLAIQIRIAAARTRRPPSGLSCFQLDLDRADVADGGAATRSIVEAFDVGEDIACGLCPCRTAQLPGQVSRSIPPERRQALQTDDWIVSETTSPVDYSPIATAAMFSNDGPSESAMKLSIRCRGGRTELVVAGPGISGRSDDYAISYRFNDGQPLQITAAVPAFGAGVTFAGDVVRLLQSLPDGGSLIIHLAPRPELPRPECSRSPGWRRCAPIWLQPANGHMPSRNPTTDAVR